MIVKMLRRFFLACCVALAAFVGACKDQRSAVSGATKAGILIINNTNYPITLDPQTATNPIDLRIASALFESLLNPHPETLAPEPGVAEKWSVSPDGTVFTFQLRKNSRWTDGSPVTAEDFLFSYRRLLSPRLAAPNASVLFVVKNAKEFYEGKIKNFAEVGFAAPDPHTLRITLAAPCPYFPSLVCNPLWAPVPQKTILKFGDFDEPDTPWTRPGTLVSNGAFRLKIWRVANYVEVERNPDFRDADTVKLNGIRFLSISDSLAEERAFRGGLLHITNTVPPMKIRELRAAGTPALRVDPFFSTTFVRVNTRVAPFNDLRVRRALSLAIEREQIAENVMRAGESPAYFLTPPGLAAGYVCKTQLHENVAEARRLLAEAGYPNGTGFPKTVYSYNMHETSQLVAQALQAMWKKNLNIDVELQNQEWKIYKQASSSGNYQIIRGAWSGDYLDPQAFLEIFTSYSEQNQTGWNDSEYDKLVEAAQSALDERERLELFRQAETRLLDALPVIPVVFNKNKFLIRPEVKGWHPNALDMHPFNTVSLEEQPAPAEK